MMKRTREEEGDQGGHCGENDANKNGVSGGSEAFEDGEDLRDLSNNKMMAEKTSGLTDTNSNQMLDEEDVQLGMAEAQDKKEQDQEEEEEEKTMKLFDLPLEILPNIFKYLDPASLKNSRLVSRLMKDFAEVSELWDWATLVVSPLNYEKVLESEVINLVSGIRSVFSTLIGREFHSVDGTSNLALKNQLGHSKHMIGG